MFSDVWLSLETLFSLKGLIWKNSLKEEVAASTGYLPMNVPLTLQLLTSCSINHWHRYLLEHVVHIGQQDQFRPLLEGKNPH